MILQKRKVGTTKTRSPSAYTYLAVGDIGPQEGISKAEKRRLEEACMTAISFIIGRSQASQEAMLNFVHDMLHSSPPARRIYALWKVRPLTVVLR